MKALIIALALLASPSLAFAVTVSDCPRNIEVKLSKVDVISADKLKSELSVDENEDGSQEKLRQWLGSVKQIEISGTLHYAEKARCEYDVDRVSDGEARYAELVFATSHGKDWLRLRMNTSAGLLGGFVTVTKYDANGLETAPNASLGMDDPGKPGLFNPTLGWAKSVETR